MLNCDLLGFQTRSDVESFRSAVVQLHGPEALLADHSVRTGGRRVVPDDYPIGADRLDYSKGLVNRFQAYDRSLETHPDNSLAGVALENARCAMDLES